MRLISVTPAGTPTAACDPVHFGGVEVFKDGQWARICNGGFLLRTRGDLFHSVAAQVRNSRAILPPHWSSSHKRKSRHRLRCKRMVKCDGTPLCMRYELFNAC